MRRIFLLCLSLIAVSVSWPASAATLQDCAATSCMYLPVIGYPSPIEMHLISFGCGELVNTSSDTLTDIRLELRSFDLHHQLVLTRTGSPDLRVMLPGGRNAFCISTGHDYHDGVDDHTYEVQVQHWSTDTHGITYVPITVSEMRRGYYYFSEILGTLRNDTPSTVQVYGFSAWLIANGSNPPPFFELARRVDMRLGKSELAPGESTTFSARFGHGGYGEPPPTTVVAIGQVVQP